MTVGDSDHRLKKDIGLLQVCAICTGVMFSSGFFLLPGLAFATTGPSVVLAYLLAGLLMIPAMFSQAELCSAMPRAGGTYYYIDRTLGPLAGTIAGIGTWIVMILKSAFALIGMGAYLLLFVDLSIQTVALILVGFFCILNIVGVRQTTNLQVILVLWLLAVLVPLVLTGITDLALRDPFEVLTRQFKPFMTHGTEGLLATIGLVVVSFAGLTKVASISEEVSDPEKNIPRGMIWSLSLATVFYVVGVSLMVAYVPSAELAGNLTPVATVALKFVHWIPPQLSLILVAAAAIAGFASAGNAGFLSASRYPLAMARDNLLPAGFAALGRFGTPTRAVLLTTAIMIASILFLEIESVAKLASSMQLFLFGLLNFAVIIMRESQLRSYDPGYYSPLYPWMQITGILVSVVLIVEMGPIPTLFTFGVAVFGTAWYRWYARAHVARGGAIYHVFAHLGQNRFEGLDRELRTILKEKGLRADDPFDEVVAQAAVFDLPERELTFDEVTRTVADSLAQYLPSTAEDLVLGFEEGTRVGSTPVARGAALPHILLHGIENPLMVLVRSRGGVRISPEELPPQFDDHGPINALFYLISPEHDPQRHLRILAQLAGRVDNDDFLPQWLGSQDEQELKEVLLRDERFLSLRLSSPSACETMIGLTLRELHMPHGCLVALIHRNSELIVPSGDTLLYEGDRITIIGDPAGIRRLGGKYAER